MGSCFFQGSLFRDYPLSLELWRALERESTYLLGEAVDAADALHVLVLLAVVERVGDVPLALSQLPLGH